MVAKWQLALVSALTSTIVLVGTASQSASLDEPIPANPSSTWQFCWRCSDFAFHGRSG